MTPSRDNRAFTLVELLVVMAIIAILVAVLLPALSAAKSQATRLRCAGNVRTLAQAALQYAHDNKGWIPRNYGDSDVGFPSWVDLMARTLRQKLPAPPARWIYTAAYDAQAIPHYREIQWLQCPVFPNERQVVDYVINGWEKYDPVGGGRSPLIKITGLKRSSEITFFMDANRNRPVDRFYRHDVWQPSHLPRGSDVRVLDDKRHRGFINVAYMDGHVGARPFKDLKATDFSLAR